MLVQIECLDNAGLAQRQINVIQQIVKQSLIDHGDASMEDEYTYTLLAHSTGKRLKDELGGIWGCIAGKYKKDDPDSKLEFSFSVSASRFLCFLVDRKLFVYCGQLYDPLGPVKQHALINKEWNLL